MAPQLAHRFPFRKEKCSVHIDDVNPELTQYCQMWTLRILVELGAHEKHIGEMHCSNPGLIKSLELGVAIDDGYDYQQVLKALKKKHRQVMRKKMPQTSDSHLLRNVSWLASELGLTDIEQSIFLFCVLGRQNIYLRQAIAGMGEMSTSRAITILATLLDTSSPAIHQAFSADSTLLQSGLIRIDESRSYFFSDKIELIDGISERMTHAQINPFDIFSDNFLAAQNSELVMDDFEHLGDRLNFLKTYLKQAIKNGQKGVNILLYGPSGTGKTQLVRALANALQANLFEVAVENKNGNRINGDDRLSAYRLSQKILAKRINSLILFDEIEDINSSMPSDLPQFSELHGNRSGRKGWLNQLLENNVVSSIWITNNIRFLDPAHLRRFDYHLQMDIPPLAVRASMLKKSAKNLQLSSHWCDAMATNAALSPALISRAIKVAGSISEPEVNNSVEYVLENVVRAALRAQNQTLTSRIPILNNFPYDLAAINSDCNLPNLIEGLRATNQGRICLYGPPGTGKSAFAKFVAAEIGKNVVVKRASDILGAFIGESEGRIAAMFSEAAEMDAILILDEADTFLSSRKGAHRSWEISLVNEMLTQMESFTGIFFCTTNLIDSLDEASLRRFDVKASFSFLKPDHVVRFFEEACLKLNCSGANEQTLALKALDKLTPGDFSNVIRQSRLFQINDPRDLYQRLLKEMKFKKTESSRPIGFLVNAV